MRFQGFASTILSFVLIGSIYSIACAGEQPVAIFHAFDEHYADVRSYVCSLRDQGYTHVQIAPAQKSNPAKEWKYRYQPVDYSIIEGRGSDTDLRNLVKKAHDCDIKVIADVVFNHMANMEEFKDHKYHQQGFDRDLAPDDFHKQCGIDYTDRNTWTEINCWLNGDLPDLDVTRQNVQEIQKKHLAMLLNLGVDGFRFDAAKHMPADVLKTYIDYINTQSNYKSWNYLEVIEDSDTSADHYKWVAAVTDFDLYRSLKNAFSYGGDLRGLRPPYAVKDPRSVTFGYNHDNLYGLMPYDRRDDSYLATAYVLAREEGVPLILAEDNLKVPYIRYGVRFRKTMHERGAQRKDVKENVLAVTDPSTTTLMMERGAEGFFVVNKATAPYDVKSMDLTLTHLEGCYKELRNQFTVAIEKRANGKKYVTRWGTWDRGGMHVEARDALYFVREPWENCQ